MSVYIMQSKETVFTLSFISNYEAVKDHISPFQHGFVSGKSTAINLTVFTNFCINNIEKGSQVDGIYTDFAKAFDRVNLNILVKKLKALGFHSTLLKWIESYLINRIQFVKIGSTISEKIYNHSGVPQGSHLGPLLFLLFINDLPLSIFFSLCLIFADDLKIYMLIKSLDDCIKLQKDLQNLSKWCSFNCLTLNINKCCVLTVSRSSYPVIFDYHISTNVIHRVNNHKDLGVIFDSKLNFGMHIDYIISRGNSMVGYMLRNVKDFRCPYTLKSLYVALVRPIFEYCCVVWSPFYRNNINRIEMIQKRFTRYALRKLNWTLPLPCYKTRCMLIAIKPLETRRIYFLISLARDVITGHINCAPLLELFQIHNPARSMRPRVHNFFSIPQHTTNYGCNEPVTKASILFNKYANVIDLECSREVFKNTIMNAIVIE